MRTASIGFLILILAAAALAQTRSISGVVVQNGSGVGSVKAELLRKGVVVEAAETDETGAFTLRVPGPGAYGFRIVKGERQIVRDVRISSGDFLIAASVDLSAEDENAISIGGRIRESVTVSADQTQPVTKVSKTVGVIDGQEMRDRADITLIDSLRSMPGLHVQQLGGPGKTASIKTRGLRNQDTSVLLDGVRLRDAAAIQGDASPFLSDITLTSVSRVEVLSGSGSSLYGTNAIGGTIDFQTPLPRSGPHGQVSYAGGGLGLNRFRGNITDGTKNGKFGFNLAAARTLFTKGIDGEDDARNTNVQSRIEWNPGYGTNVSGRFFVSNAFVRLNSGPDTLGTLPPSNSTIIRARPGVNFVPDTNDPVSDQRSELINGQVVFTQVLSATASVRAYYSDLRTSRRSNNSGFSLSYFDGAIRTANATISWSPNRIHEVKGGYEFEHEKYRGSGLTTDRSGDFFSLAYQGSHTLFAQDVVSIADGRLQLAGGFRVQFYSLDDPRFSLSNAPYSNIKLDGPAPSYTFDGAISYFVRSTGTKIRAHAGNGYRVPSLYERFGTFFSTFFGPQFIALGDPNLRPEKSIAFDGGVEQYLAGDKVKLSAIYFYTKLLDTIGFGNVVPNIGPTIRPFGGYENQSGGISRGAEFTATLRPARSTELFSSYSFTNSDRLGTRVAGSGIAETLGVPKHRFTLVATQRFSRFWINTDVLTTSSYLGPIFSNTSFSSYVYRFGGNRRVDLTAGYNFPLRSERLSLRVFATVENLLDHDYFENGFRTVPRNGRVGVSFGF